MHITSSDKHMISQLLDTIAEGLSHYALKFKYQKKHSENVKGELYTLIRRHCNQLINKYLNVTLCTQL